MWYISYMPTVLRIGGYRFFFYSSDRGEPLHIHVEKGEAVAKIWLEPVRLASSRYFSSTEINQILKNVEKHQAVILEAWNEFFES
jgi:hypothetical protein